MHKDISLTALGPGPDGLSPAEKKLLAEVDFSDLAAKLGLSWQELVFHSLKDQPGSAVDRVRRNVRSCFLLGAAKKPVVAELLDKGFGGLMASLLEDLGLASERLQSGPLKDLTFSSEEGLSVLLVDNPHYDARVRFGLPDGEFIRGDVPMTKSSVRAWIMANLAIRPEEICWDVGAGTGSCTVEMALAAYEGRVYAIEKDPEGMDLIRQNLRHFQLGNVEIVPGPAPEFFADLPQPDVVFIGGTGGKMREIIQAVVDQNPQARMVITAVALETLVQACQVLSELGLSFELSEVAVSKGQKSGPHHLLKGENPSFVICVDGQQA